MKKESAVFVRVPIMAFGILLLICNCALAQKELVIEYTAESERMRCTIEEYVQNGDEIKYSVQDEPADIQIMTVEEHILCHKGAYTGKSGITRERTGKPWYYRNSKR